MGVGHLIPWSPVKFTWSKQREFPLTYVEGIKRSANTDKLVNVICKENAFGLVWVPVTDKGG